MKYGRRIFVGLVLAAGLLAPLALAQRPRGPSPTPAPSPTPTPAPGVGPSGPSTVPSTTSQPTDSDVVVFLTGRVATSDNTALPDNVLVERLCNNRVSQQIYASLIGDFRMELASKTDAVIDATADPSSLDKANNPRQGGIPRPKLASCELRASASGFRSNVVNLIDLDVFGGTADVGAIVLERLNKVQGTTLSAVPYLAPTGARKAYEKGLEAAGKNKLGVARKDFEKAVEIYPKFTHAWFQLGSVLEKQGQKEEARAAYTHATTIDTRFFPPYLALASMAYEAEDWNAVLLFTTHILELDPWNHRDFNGYMVSLDAVNYAEAYFYSAMANFQLNRMEAAEKSAIKAEHLDMRTRYPELHLLMAEILAQKGEYAAAIPELQEYLQLVPHPGQLELLQRQLAEWEKLSGAVAANGKPVRK